MDEFDHAKVDQISKDYSVFHPTPTQVEIIYTLCDHLSSKYHINPFIARQLFIRGITKHQEYAKMFHYEIEKNLPPIRLKLSANIIEFITNEFLNLLEEQTPEGVELIRKEMDDVLKEYIATYANRPVE